MVRRWEACAAAVGGGTNKAVQAFLACRWRLDGMVASDGVQQDDESAGSGRVVIGGVAVQQV